MQRREERDEVLSKLGNLKDSYEDVIVRILPAESKAEYDKLVKNKK